MQHWTDQTSCNLNFEAENFCGSEDGHNNYYFKFTDVKCGWKLHRQNLYYQDLVLSRIWQTHNINYYCLHMKHSQTKNTRASWATNKQPKDGSANSSKVT